MMILHAHVRNAGFIMYDRELYLEPWKPKVKAYMTNLGSLDSTLSGSEISSTQCYIINFANVISHMRK